MKENRTCKFMLTYPLNKSKSCKGRQIYKTDSTVLHLSCPKKKSSRGHLSKESIGLCITSLEPPPPHPNLELLKARIFKGNLLK